MTGFGLVLVPTAKEDLGVLIAEWCYARMLTERTGQVTGLCRLVRGPLGLLHPHPSQCYVASDRTNCRYIGASCAGMWAQSRPPSHPCCCRGSSWPPWEKQAAQLLIKAGADQELIPAWIEEGGRRSEAARGIPYTGSW